MQYITYRRFKGISICGNINIPAMSECAETNGIITYNGKKICVSGSENAHQYFAPNYDGHGMERGKLTQEIQKKLAKVDDNHQARWDRVWEDNLCQKYKRSNYKEHWLWNHAFYGANIDDLRYIMALIDF